MVEDAFGLIVGTQERLNPLSQGEISPAFAVYHGRPVGEILLFDGREEHGLDAFRVYGHGMVLQWVLPYHATSAAGAVEKSQKNSVAPKCVT